MYGEGFNDAGLSLKIVIQKKCRAVCGHYAFYEFSEKLMKVTCQNMDKVIIFVNKPFYKTDWPKTWQIISVMCFPAQMYI